MNVVKQGAAAGKRTVDRVYEDIRRGILTGRLRPGERITEEWLAERFRASRTPVRAAVLKLAGDGFVEMTPRSGAMVKQRSAQEIVDIYNVRALLESAAAGLAARHCSVLDLTEISALQDEMEHVLAAHSASSSIDDRTGNPAVDPAGNPTGNPIADPAGDPIAPDRVERLSVLNKAFHQRILEACGNATLRESAERLMDIGFLINTYLRFSPADIARSLSEHRNLVSALSSRDSDWAEALMRAHVLSTRNALQAMACT